MDGGKLIAEKNGAEWEDITHKLRAEDYGGVAVGLYYKGDRVAFAHYDDIKFQPTMTQDYIIETKPKRKFNVYKFIRIINRGNKGNNIRREE